MSSFCENHNHPVLPALYTCGQTPTNGGTQNYSPFISNALLAVRLFQIMSKFWHYLYACIARVSAQTWHRIIKWAPPQISVYLSTFWNGHLSEFLQHKFKSTRWNSYNEKCLQIQWNLSIVDMFYNGRLYIADKVLGNKWYNPLL